MVQSSNNLTSNISEKHIILRIKFSTILDGYYSGSPWNSTSNQYKKKLAKKLLETLKEQKLVLDWKKRTQTRADVELTIEDYLWERLPNSKYDTQLKRDKTDKLYEHIYESYQGAGVSIYTVSN
jgi:hypothetical protein